MLKELFKTLQNFYLRLIRSFRSLSKREKLLVYALLLVIVVASLVKVRGLYLAGKDKEPARGGVYKEGIIGQPQYINPLLATNEAEKSIVKLVFNSAYTYSNQGKLVPQMAKKLSSSKDNTTYTLTLADGWYWSDGEKVKASDLIATVNLIQSDEYSGLGQESWQGVEIEKVGEKQVRFKLKEPNTLFKEVLTLSWLPKHKIEELPPEKLSLNKINQEPVGSGPYQVENIVHQGEHSQVILTPNPYYNKEKPYLSKVAFFCYNSYSQMLEGLKSGQVSALSFIQPDDYHLLGNKEDKYQLRELKLPRLTAAFFNLQNKYLKEKKFRQGLNLAVDKKNLIEETLSGYGKRIKGPFYDSYQKKASYQPEKAKNLIKEVLNKEEPQLNLITSQDELQERVAHYLKRVWEEAGLKIKINSLPAEEVSQFALEGKNYDILLLGQNLSMRMDLYPFWHSSQIKEGYNFSQYSDSTADHLLEEIRLTSDEKKIENKKNELANKIRSDYPACFLFSRPYLHLVPYDLKGVDKKTVEPVPEERFSNIEDWYLKEKIAD